MDSAALSASERRFYLLVDAVKDYAIIMLDAERRVASWNAGAERINGYRVDEIVGRPYEVFYTGEDVARGLPREMLDAAASTGRVEAEGWRVRKDGSRFLAHAIINLIRDATGAQHGFAEITRDITEQRKMQAQLLRAQKLETVGRLAGSLAHDFNNLLTTIAGHSDLAAMLLPQGDPVNDDLAEIRKAVDLASGITRQLLTLARRQVITPRLVDLVAMIREMDKLLRGALPASINLLLDLQPGTGVVQVDRAQLERVVINLVFNARDAMPDGGNLRIATQTVSLSAQDAARLGLDAGDYAALLVGDTGTGMDADVLAHLFEPFFTTKEPDKGTGLGLTTAYSAITQHDGAIDVESVVGKGSSFTIYLPLASESEGGRVDESPESMLPRGTETVLLVEDNPAVRAITTRVLRSLGYKVLVAHRGEEALEVAAAHGPEPIHLLLSDVVLPGMSGPAVAERLSARRHGLKVLFVSGYIADESVTSDANAGRINTLLKPFGPTALARAVRRTLDA